MGGDDYASIDEYGIKEWELPHEDVWQANPWTGDPERTRVTKRRITIDAPPEPPKPSERDLFYAGDESLGEF